MKGTRRALSGHVAPGDAFDPLAAVDQLPALGRLLTRYRRSEDLWKVDAAMLPWPLRRLRRQVRAFAERELRPRAERLDRARALPAGELDPAAPALLRAAAREGLLSNLLPRPLGSLAPSLAVYPVPLRLAVQVEELARVDGGQALLLSAHQLGLAPLALSGDLKAWRRFLLPALRELRRGEPHVFAFAITEPAGGSNVQDGAAAASYQPELVALRGEGGWYLRGWKRYISGGDIAGSVTVCAALEGEGMASWTCFLVRRDMPGFHLRGTELKMGMRASGAATLQLDDVFVPDSHVIGGLRRGWAISRATLNASRLPVAALAVGLAAGATEAALEFALRQRLGGRPLIDYQEIQLQVAQMIGETRALRSLVWAMARQSWQPRQANASVAKFNASDRAQHVCELAMELMGNHGGLADNRVERFYRDVRLTRIFEGTNEINRLAVIEDLQPQVLDQLNRDPCWRG